MKHAVIIMAHKNMEQLCHLVEYFRHDCYVLIHLDRKFKAGSGDLRRLKSFPQVVGVYQKFRVCWGGFSILRCELFMLRMVLKLCDADYVHLLSGQDYPTMPIDGFLRFFEKYKDKDCLQYVHLPHMNWENNTFRRFEYFYPYDLFHDRRHASVKVRRFVNWQRRLGIRRRMPAQFEHLYGSSQWFSIRREAARMIVDYTRRHPWLCWRMWMTFAPEESYIATVLANLRQGRDILFTNFRFIRWKYENGNCPANLDLMHLKYIISGKYVFARKVEMPVSSDLVKAIDRYFINNRNTPEPMANGGWDYDGYAAYSYDPDFTDAVLRICRLTDISEVLDAGCGTGLYVAILREHKIAASGFDANPYTEKLSSLLMDKGPDPCVQADLLDEEVEVESPFNLVICKDVLQYIRPVDLPVAVRHLAGMSNRYILLAWHLEADGEILQYFCHEEGKVDMLMRSNGFSVENILTKQVRQLQPEGTVCKVYNCNDT